MPWTPESFKAKHNKGLSPAASVKAAAQANAILKSGVDEGEAIAIANKNASKNKAMKATGFRGKKTRRYTGA